MNKIYAVKLINDEDFINLVFNNKELIYKQFFNEALKRKQNNAFQQKVVGEMLARKAIEMETGIWYSEEFDRNLNGKPLPNGFKNCFISISHSNEWVIVAISNKTIGVDIEKVRNISIDLPKRFFAQNEVDRLEKIESKNDFLNDFFRLWTLKESYVKAIGSTISKTIPYIYVVENNDTISLIHFNKTTNFKFRLINFKQLFMIAICSLNNIATNDIINEIDIQLLIEKQ